MGQARPARIGNTDLEITFRPARPDETPALSNLALRSKAHWGYDADFLEKTERELTVKAVDAARGRVFLAEQRDAVVGFYGLEHEPPVMGLDSMFVDPKCNGTGVGAALMDHAKATAKAFGATTLQIEADPNAEGFYLRVGAQRIGETPSGSIPGRLLPLLELTL